MRSHLNPQARASLEALQSTGAPSIYAHLSGVFIESSEKFLKVFANPATDQASLERAAHSWKGIAQGMGATELSDLCLKLELVAMVSSADERAPIIDALIEEYALVKAELLAQLE